MQELFDILERHGFVGVQDAEKVYELPARKLETLHWELVDHIYKRQSERVSSRKIPPPSAFSFHAGASIRGASGCSELGCRLQKLDFLARYSALYANELTFPLAMPNPKGAYDDEEVRCRLELDLVSLLFLRPLVTAGLIIPVVMRTWHCVHERDWFRKLTELVHDFSQAIIARGISNRTLPFVIKFQRNPQQVDPQSIWRGRSNISRTANSLGSLTESRDGCPDQCVSTNRVLRRYEGCTSDTCCRRYLPTWPTM